MKNEYVKKMSVEDLYDHTPRRGRPPKPKGRPGPKPKDVIPELTLMEDAMREALGMPRTKTYCKDNESPEEQEAHRAFIHLEVLHTARLGVLWIKGCVAGKFHVEPERAKLASASINHAIGTPVQKVSVVGESQETKDYVETLKFLMSKGDDVTQIKEEENNKKESETPSQLAEGV